MSRPFGLVSTRLSGWNGEGIRKRCSWCDFDVIAPQRLGQTFATKLVSANCCTKHANFVNPLVLRTKWKISKNVSSFSLHDLHALKRTFFELHIILCLSVVLWKLDNKDLVGIVVEILLKTLSPSQMKSGNFSALYFSALFCCTY